jgi:hypothetical protein
MNRSIDQFFALFILFVSVTLVLVALPRFRAAFNYIPVDTAVQRVHRKGGLAKEKIPELIERGQESIDLFDLAGYWNGISALKFYQAQSEVVSSYLNQESFSYVQNYNKQSLSRSPANSYLWYKQAIVLFKQEKASGEIADALIMSILTGPNESGILIDRLRLCFMVFSEFKGDDRDILVSQVMLAWNAAPNDFLKDLASERKNRIFLVLLLNENHPQILDKMVLSFEHSD